MPFLGHSGLLSLDLSSLDCREVALNVYGGIAG